ncbi:MAG: XdhC family protein [Mogibacterium sp.]|nr:XdhC family protein [Mogibacterium sp.]
MEGAVAENLKSLKGGDDVFIVTMMRAHALDQMNLEVLLPLESAYIGMLGSEKKVNAIKGNLDAKGFDLRLFDKLNTPIGLDINAQTPEEIAIAIVGQIIQIKNAKVQHGEAMTDEMLEAVIGGKSPSILATLIRKKTASPRDPGTKMVIYHDGSKVGTIGGGLAEAETIKLAAELMSDPEFRTCVHTVGEGKIKVELSGMVCSGVLEVLLERI